MKYLSLCFLVCLIKIYVKSGLGEILTFKNHIITYGRLIENQKLEWIQNVINIFENQILYVIVAQFRYS